MSDDKDLNELHLTVLGIRCDLLESGESFEGGQYRQWVGESTRSMDGGLSYRAKVTIKYKERDDDGARKWPWMINVGFADTFTSYVLAVDESLRDAESELRVEVRLFAQTWGHFAANVASKGEA